MYVQTFIDIHGRISGDSEFVSITKFLKRAAETFSRNHAVQVKLSSETGARIVDPEVGELFKTFNIYIINALAK